ncbi:MAG: FAD-binding protein, partial [Betaproteobacteria bacterium]|nr:FAD-binding protein [Betaproteobacteria bacterium]
MDTIDSALDTLSAPSGGSREALDPALRALCDQVMQAHEDGTPLEIRGGATKAFYGNTPVGQCLDTRGLQGVLQYEPSELVVTVRAGTPLAELEALLEQQGPHDWKSAKTKPSVCDFGVGARTRSQPAVAS